MIKNLLFDLGGVIMNIRRQNCVEAFRRLGMANPDAYLGEYSQSGPFQCIEDGSCSISEFHDEIRRIVGNPGLTGEAIDEAFGKFLLGIPEARLDELVRLRATYRVYLLSNTNPVMWGREIKWAFEQQGHDVDWYFDGIVKSYEARCMKPDPRIFEFACARLGIQAGETLFLDDSQKNLDAAAALGFRTLLVKPGSEFYTLLGEYPGIHLI